MTQLEELVDTLLWEGHQLFPYTPSATKNATPTPFGIVYPPAYAAGSPHTFERVKLQCIATGTDAFSATVHWIQDGEAQHVEVSPGTPATFPRGRAWMETEDFGGLTRVTVAVENTVDVAADIDRNEALLSSLLSTHVVARCGAGGRFFSPTAPPEDVATAVMTCANVNIHPVLASPDDDAILGAAIFLPDHPELAPESRGNLFDSTEIEEALLLHVLALSDGEREELQSADPAVKAMIERAVAATPQDIMSLHGRVTVSDPPPPGEDRVEVGGRVFRRGDHVILRPDPSRHAQDHLLAGRSARIERILLDYDDAIHLCVTVDDDPGQELMREIGRFLYFKPAEVEIT
jgi:hypothetical protein